MKKLTVYLSLLLCALLIFSSCGAKDVAMDAEMPMMPSKGQNYFYSTSTALDGVSKIEMEMVEESITVGGTDDEKTGEVVDIFKLIENPFISTADENVSTFSADVDTASYAYFRKLVEEGYSLSELIATAGSSIRTEEMINYFDYGYASPAEGELFSTKVQIAPCPWNNETSLLVLGMKTAETPIAARNNLVFLIDVSGSMRSSDKLELLKKAFEYLVENIGEDDTISIVTYAGEERVVLDGCEGSKKTKILNAVRSLNSGGSTNGEAGLKKAYQLAEKHFIEGGNNRIIMASDGDLNVGMSSVDEIESFVSEKRESGVFMSVLGFGTGNYKDNMMEKIADCGNGVYYYIDSETEAEKIFGEELFSTLYTVAKDVKLQLTFSEEAVKEYRLVGYENRLLANEDFENDTKDAGELGSGHSITVCYELKLGGESIEAPWIDLAVRYKAPDGNKSELNEYSFGGEAYTAAPDDTFKFITSLIETSMILHESEYIGDITLENVADTLHTLKLDDEYKKQFVDLIDTLIKN